MTQSETNRTQELSKTNAVDNARLAAIENHGNLAQVSSRKATDVRVVAAAMYLLPVKMRVPLQFGGATVESVHCIRVRMRVRDAQGRTAEGWGETPLSVQWAWPSKADYGIRFQSMIAFCERLTQYWPEFEAQGHPLELGHDLQTFGLPDLINKHNQESTSDCPITYLAALVCASAFDLALHDAYGNVHDVDIYNTYNSEFMNFDLSAFLLPVERGDFTFTGLYPENLLVSKPPTRLPAWHLVGGLDPLSSTDTNGNEPSDGYPVLLRDWIATDGLKCLKVKLRGYDDAWDYQRLVQVGQIAAETGVESLSADFNCLVSCPDYVSDILDRLQVEQPETFDRLLYVEQPFAYDLDEHRQDVHSVSERKPLFLDESAHDWKCVRLGRELGWTGVALKTCKTQTGAILSLCWARAHQMAIMVQDLTNPMLAQIPHVRLAAQAGTIRGVETNAMQFYPDASQPEAAIHPGLYVRRDGQVDLSSLSGPGFGYRLDEIDRTLPEPAAVAGSW